MNGGEEGEGSLDIELDAKITHQTYVEPLNQQQHKNLIQITTKWRTENYGVYAKAHRWNI